MKHQEYGGAASARAIEKKVSQKETDQTRRPVLAEPSRQGQALSGDTWEMAPDPVTTTRVAAIIPGYDDEEEKKGKKDKKPRAEEGDETGSASDDGDPVGDTGAADAPLALARADGGGGPVEDPRATDAHSELESSELAYAPAGGFATNAVGRGLLSPVSSWLVAGTAVEGASYANKKHETQNLPEDHTAPKAPNLRLHKDTGRKSSDHITNDNKMYVRHERGASWEYSLDGGKTWKRGTGDDFEIPEGHYAKNQIQARQTDAAGNKSEITKVDYEVTIDTVKPDAPEIESVEEDNTGMAHAMGTAEKNATVEVTWPDGTKTSATADDEGNWEAISSKSQPNGEVTAIAIDVAGNKSYEPPEDEDEDDGESGSSDQSGSAKAKDESGLAKANFKDDTPPETPDKYSMLLKHDTGKLTSDRITYDGCIEVNNLEKGAKLQYSTDHGKTWHDAKGSSFDVPPGTYEVGDIQARQVDAAGHAGPPAEYRKKLVVDKEVETPGMYVDGKKMVVTGIEDGATWKYSLDGGKTWMDGEGNGFDLPDDAKLDDIQVMQTDVAGNRSEPGTYSLLVNASLANDTGADDKDGITNDGRVTVKGVKDGSTVQYSTDGGNTWTDVQLHGGAFTLPEGTYSHLMVRQVDKAGNAGDPPADLGRVAVDKEAPQGLVTDSVGQGQGGGGWVATGTVTYEEGITVTVTWPDGSHSTATVDKKTGKWTATSERSSPRSGDVTVTATDKAGNEVSTTSSFHNPLSFHVPTANADSVTVTVDGKELDKASLTQKSQGTDTTFCYRYSDLDPTKQVIEAVYQAGGKTHKLLLSLGTDSAAHFFRDDSHAGLGSVSGHDSALDITQLDTRSVTKMNFMFLNATGFNQDIGDWDVSNVRDMSGMFYEATGFNQDIGDWDVSNVRHMNCMFCGATGFNQDIGDWDVSNVRDMNWMFEDATGFNQDIGDWDVSNVRDMSGMFAGATGFNQDIGDWDVSSVTDMSGMFDNSGLSTENYDRILGGWSDIDSARGEGDLQEGVTSNRPQRPSDPTAQKGVTLGAGGKTYTDATAHWHLTHDWNWNIDDGGLARTFTDENGVYGTKGAVYRVVVGDSEGSGEAKNDRLDFHDKSENYIIHGLDGDDRITGGSGNDRIVGGDGDDTLTGGAGNDTFVYGYASEGRDTITDFNKDQDVIDISRLLDTEKEGKDLEDVIGHFVRAVEDDNGDVRLEFDPDGCDGMENFDASVSVALEGVRWDDHVDYQDYIRSLIDDGHLVI